MVNQGPQGPNQIDNSANLLQQQHNFDVQVGVELLFLHPKFVVKALKNLIGIERSSEIP